MTKFLSEPEGFHDLWGQCKGGVYDKKAWNEFQQRLISQAKCIAELQHGIREAIRTLEIDEASARPGWVVVEVRGILKEVLGE